MLRIFGFLRSRVLWVTVGLITLCLLIWFFGDLFAFGDTRPLESDFARLFLIGLILAYFLVRLLIMRWRAGRMNDRIANMLRTSLSAETVEDKGQAAILKDRFTEALNILRKARFETDRPSFLGRIARHGRYVYELPWYVIIGAPGVGKTTALLNSGLSFPLSSQIGAAAIRGAGGTRNCDWWFTNEAVFIDTAGRYTTHETDVQTDKAEWRGFLSLLKKNRTRQPINGVLVMLSVAELLGQGRDECQKHAATLRQRLDELRNDLGMPFPVYLLVNKCDLLLGFDEYFSALDRSGRAQVWGVTLPLDPSGKYLFDPGKLASECDLLQTRINVGLVDVLQAEPDLTRRELIYAFPQQFDVLTQVLKGMLSDLLGTSRFSESPFLRGIYFTSATQEGTPFDRVVHALGQGFQVQRPQKAPVAGEGKAYFLHELLSKVVFGEAHIAGQDRRAEQRSYALHTGGYVFSVLALAGAALAWATSRHNNWNYLNEVDSNVAAMGSELSKLPSTASDDIGQLLQMLDRAEFLLDTESVNVDHPRLGWRFGLFQGSDLRMKVKGERGLYGQLLSKRLAPTIETNLEQRLRRAVDAGDMDLLYDVLRAYLMMYEPDRLNESAFIDSVDAVLGSGFAGEESKSLERHVRTLIAMNALASSKTKNEKLVMEARAKLKDQTSAARVFSRVKRSPQFSKLQNFSMLNELDGQVWPLAFMKGEPGQFIAPLYTKKGYELFKEERKRVLSIIGKDESWVLGGDENTRNKVTDPIELANRVTVLYINEYILNWQGYTDNVGVVGSRTLDEAAQIVTRLSMQDSPLLRFLKGVVRETELVKEPDKKGNTLADTIGDRIRRGIDGTVGTPGAADAASRLLPRDDEYAMEVNKHFANLRKFVNGSGGDGSDAQIYQEMKLLNGVKELLEQAIYNKGRNQPMPSTAPLVSSLNIQPGAKPEPYRSVLMSVAKEVKARIDSAESDRMTHELKDEVTEFCKKTITGRYPFNPSATSSVAPNDFADMFAPGGRMDRFRQQQGSGANLPASFDYARTIRDTFFRNGNQPEISFTVSPLSMDSSITNLTLNIGGQQVRYAHGPIVPTTITWPGSGSGEVRLALLPTIENGVNNVNETGLWALHRLFDKHGQISRGSSPDVFVAVIAVGGRRATFEIRPASSNNPFNLSELRKFTCPQVIPRG
ncbi:MAG: type VI secretion system membrane subunit TssM [Betaproteobacteria bacterium]|nr:type VI secretion system membrane subunit TssM [Betaproteobacteria bacterium]